MRRLRPVINTWVFRAIMPLAVGGLAGRRGRLAGVLLLGLAACTTGGDISNPVIRKVTWFSFLNGDDIRAACTEGAPDRLRLVHNANYTHRVRVYDLTAVAPGGPPGIPPGIPMRMTTRVIGGPTNHALVTLGDPSSLFAPWAGEVRQTTLAPAEVAALRTVLDRDGLGQPAPAGTQLLSQRYWWVAVGCLGGRVAFQVWAHPDRGYDGLAFPAWLQARDGTDIPLRTPADEPQHANPAVMDRDYARHEVRFRLAVGQDRLNP